MSIWEDVVSWILIFVEQGTIPQSMNKKKNTGDKGCMYIYIYLVSNLRGICFKWVIQPPTRYLYIYIYMYTHIRYIYIYICRFLFRNKNILRAWQLVAIPLKIKLSWFVYVIFTGFVLFVVQVAGGMLEPVLNIVWEPMPRVNLVIWDRMRNLNHYSPFEVAMCIICLWVFPKMVVPNNHGFSY